ncbi:MAG: serine hydrolase domain-containing protein [Cyclobacteriaceae bacterium]
MNKLLILAVAIAASFLFGCQTQESPYQKAVTESARLLDSIRINQKIPGIDAAISIDGKIVWSQGFGFADLELQVPVKPGETKFRIGSVSKPLSVAALGKLVDEGKVNLQDEVQTYVPYFPKKEFPITVKQTAGHIAGIRHYRGDEFILDKHYNSVRQSLEIFDKDSFLFEPGTQYSYSSYGFNLLSAVIEEASHQQFLNYMQQVVFDPLQMTATCADKNDSIILNRTSFYDLDSLGNVINATHVDNSYKWAGGGFISTTNDLVKFGEAHMSPGFLSAETLKEFTTSQVLNNGDSTGYGVGWGRIETNGVRGFGHTGGSVGGITAFRIYPTEGLILVFLSNSSVTKYGTVGDRIVNLFLTAKAKQK